MGILSGRFLQARLKTKGYSMDLARLNINIGGLPSCGYQGDVSVFDQVALLVGVPLPPSYLELIHTADGGHPEIGCFSPIGADDENMFEIDYFYAFDNLAVERVQDVIEKWTPFLGERTLPIGRDGGGNLIFLDMSSGSETVWIALHDQGMKKIKIAESFESFINSLRANPDFI